MPPWSPAHIADVVEAGLKARARADDAEQAVYGFDALPELGLHPLIQSTLRDAGFGVHPEQRYPGMWNRRRQSEGQRCDLVLTRDGLPLRDPEMKDTLFASQAAEDADTAYWLEVKTVAQFETTGPFSRYAAELLNPVMHDVKKLADDDVIRFAGLLLVLFTESPEIAQHDLDAWHHQCHLRGRTVASVAVRGFPITDRIGNAWCAPTLFHLRGGCV